MAARLTVGPDSGSSSDRPAALFSVVLGFLPLCAVVVAACFAERLVAGPYWDWNAARLAISFALVQGYELLAVPPIGRPPSSRPAGARFPPAVRRRGSGLLRRAARGGALLGLERREAGDFLRPCSGLRALSQSDRGRYACLHLWADFRGRLPAHYSLRLAHDGHPVGNRSLDDVFLLAGHRISPKGSSSVRCLGDARLYLLLSDGARGRGPRRRWSVPTCRRAAWRQPAGSTI